jgi:secreted Zn-dependent insulinase-like peptidase
MVHSTIYRRGLKALLTASTVLFIAACASVPQPALQPVQSPNDDSAYRYLVLDNGLQVLLVSDPDTRKAAASLNVEVGSGDNPPGRGGLAHFLEHMLFLGTDKYPDHAEYERFITEHGGSRNAYTSFEHTNYFFDVDEAHFAGALDRFAQFFIAPRFDAEYVEREKNAVEAEYQMGLKSDPRRGLDVFQAVMNPAHPFSQFSVGSLETLADRPGSAVRDELLAFYDRYYSANLMRLVVYGSEPLDELEALVTPLFSQVPNKDYRHEAIETPIFPPGSLPMLVKVRPEATLRQLEVSFPLADYRPEYHTKPLAYLGNLLGHEGEGSLLSRLKSEGLAESLGAGTGLSWRGGSLFSLSISLTEKGVVDYERVLQLIFAYADMLREEGPRARLYDEQTRIADLSFRFREDSGAMGYVTSLSTGMQHYAPQDILRGPYIMDDYRPQMLREAVAAIRPDNAVVTLTDAAVETDRLSAHYEVPYAVETIGREQLARWQTPVAAELFALPAPNPFIADDVSLETVAAGNPPHPKIVRQSERLVAWFRQDDEFRVPRGATYVNFKSPLVGQTAEQAASAGLYVALLKDAVNEYTYPAHLAGLSFDLYKHAQGVSLRISGYDDKQDVLLDALVRDIARPEFEPARFDNIRLDLIRSLENVRTSRPSSQVIGDLREAMQHGQWGEEALIEVLEGITLADIEAYAAQFWAGARAEIMLYGNYPPAAVDVVAERVTALLPAGDPAPLPPLEVVKLEAGEAVRYPVDIPHDDAVVAWYLQGAGDSWKDRAATALTAQIMKSGFFNELRTEQQLGYIVNAFYYPQLDVPGLLMLVQSPAADAGRVAGSMQRFTGSVVASLDPAQFERHRQALLSEVLEPDKNLWERAEFYWQSIAKRQWDFQGREQLSSSIKELSMAQWQGYYESVFIDAPRSLQVVAPGKSGVLPAGPGRLVGSAGEIKNGHSTYIVY